MKYIPYNKKLTKLAQQNRKNPTKPEAKIWNKLLREKTSDVMQNFQGVYDNLILEIKKRKREITSNN